jgi:hypothetical protein
MKSKNYFDLRGCGLTIKSFDFAYDVGTVLGGLEVVGVNLKLYPTQVVCFYCCNERGDVAPWSIGAPGGLIFVHSGIEISE